MEEDENDNSEHGIINYKLLVDLAIKQGPKGEAGRLFREDGVRLEEVKEMRIEFLNIICLEHLWPMKNLRKLTLSHNCIEKIEKLDDLIELRELDLSFNRISIMEGLNHLINLEILILSGNEIREIEAIDDLRNLTIFSVANNKIDSWNHVMYLRKFEKLRSLNMQGNPCMQQADYVNYVIAFIPQIIYLSYRMIMEAERNKARELHRLSISKTEDSETNLRRSLAASKEKDEKRAQDTSAFIENLNGEEFFNLLFQNDEEGRALAKVSEDTKATHEEYKKKINEISFEIYEFGRNEGTRRTEEIEMFRKTMEDEKNSVKFIARSLMTEISEHRDKILDTLKKKSTSDETLSHQKSLDTENSTNEIDFEEIHKITEDFSIFLSSKWTKLMYNEVVLHEQVEDLVESFKSNMSDMIGEFATFVREKFTRMRSAEVEYRDEIDRIVGSHIINNFSDESAVPEDLKKLCGNTEALDNSLTNSHDLHLQLIDSREETMSQRIKSWFDGFIEELVKRDSELQEKSTEISLRALASEIFTKKETSPHSPKTPISVSKEMKVLDIATEFWKFPTSSNFKEKLWKMHFKPRPSTSTRIWRQTLQQLWTNNSGFLNFIH